MVKIIEKYLERKHIKAKITIDINESTYQSLVPLVEKYGEDTFNGQKSALSHRTIKDTIPTMINNSITNVLENLEKIKTVRRNSLDHYVLLYGDQAYTVYQERVEKGLQTQDNFVKRHGQIKGKKLWRAYSLNKKKQNTLEGFQERHGNELGLIKFNEYSERQRYTNSIEYYIEQYGCDVGPLLYNERYPSDYNLDEYADYKKVVYKLSNQVYNSNKEIINPDNYPRTRMGVAGGWQLDHIKPVNECFKEGMSAEKAADVSNLRMLTWRENLMRNYK